MGFSRQAELFVLGAVQTLEFYLRLGSGCWAAHLTVGDSYRIIWDIGVTSGW